MKLLDRIWNFLGLVETEDADESSVSYSDKPTPRSERKPERPAKTYEESNSRMITPPVYSTPPPSIPSPAARTSVTSTVAVPVSSASSVNEKCKVVITQPIGFDDARQIAENLTNGKTVVVNFERTDAETTKRTVDFMSGITYAVGGTVQRISHTIFLFAPAQIEVFSPERFVSEEQGSLPWQRS